MDHSRAWLSRFRSLLAWLVHPVTLVAVVLLAVNDHVFKARYPGLLTGKLSDAAGLMVAPPLLALALMPFLPRRSAKVLACTAVTVTGAGFCAVKLSPTGAAVTSAVWSNLTGPSMILADQTDLAVLPALGLAWWAWTRACRRPLSRLAARRLATLIALPAATLALVATPAPRYPDAVAVTSWRGLIVIGDGNAYHQAREPRSFRVSRDGQTWRFMTEAEQTEFDLVRATLPLQAHQSCLPGRPNYCYRVVPGHLRVEETSDRGATWSISWQVPDDRRGYLARHYDGMGDIEDYLASRALTIHPVPGGHVVIVANGRDGYARRDVSGRWERIGFGSNGSAIGWGASDNPPPVTGGLQVLRGELAAAFLIGLFAFGMGAWRRAGAVRGAAIGFGAALLVGTPIAFSGAIGLNNTDPLFPMAHGILLLGSVPMMIGAVGFAVLRAGGWRWLMTALLIATGTAACCAAPFVGWASGICDYRTAALTALLIAMTGAALSIWSGGRAVQAPAESPLPP